MYLNTGTLSVKYLIYIFLFIFLQQFFIANKIFAQSVKNIHIDPLSTNSLSGSYSNFNYIFDWNMGEVFSNTLSNSSKILITQGFLQSFEKDIIIKQKNDTSTSYDTLQKYIIAYPNPVRNNLQITLIQYNLKILSINLLDQNGNTLQFYDEQFNNQLHYAKSISMGKYPPNIYLLSVKYVLKGNFYRTKIFKIVKI